MGVTAVVEGGLELADRTNPTLATWGGGALVFAGGAGLLIGFLTPVAGAVVAAGSAGFALSAAPSPAASVFDDALATFFVIMMAAAIVLLGPGAFSLDSYLFGRREIIIPHGSSSPKGEQ